MAKYDVAINLCTFVIFSMWGIQSFGAEMINEYPAIEPAPYTGSGTNLLSDREFLLSMVAIFFGLIVLIIEYKLLIRANASSGEVLKVLIVSTIVIATMFIISAGYSSEQIAPAIGLFGTIAGYLLGRNEKHLSSKKSEKEES